MRARILLLLLIAARANAQHEPTPQAIFAAALSNIVQIIAPTEGSPARTFTTRLEFSNAQGVPARFANSTLELALQAPDRLLVSGIAGDESYTLARNGQQLWAYVPGKRFAVVGEPGQPRFLSAPHKEDATTLEPLKLPLP